MRKRKSLVDSFLNELVNFGGEIKSRGQVYKFMKKRKYPKGAAEYFAFRSPVWKD